MLDVNAEIHRCAAEVHHHTMLKVVTVESEGNPYAIGVVNGTLERQPRTLQEAIVTVQVLEREGWNYSVGLAQINRTNFRRFGLSTTTAFEPCHNLQAGAAILKECYLATKSHSGTARERQLAIRDALSCYYSGNFVRGHQLGYVQKVVEAEPVSVPDGKKGGAAGDHHRFVLR